MKNIQKIKLFILLLVGLKNDCIMQASDFADAFQQPSINSNQDEEHKNNLILHQVINDPDFAQGFAVINKNLNEFAPQALGLLQGMRVKLFGIENNEALKNETIHTLLQDLSIQEAFVDNEIQKNLNFFVQDYIEDNCNVMKLLDFLVQQTILNATAKPFAQAMHNGIQAFEDSRQDIYSPVFLYVRNYLNNLQLDVDKLWMLAGVNYYCEKHANINSSLLSGAVYASDIQMVKSLILIKAQLNVKNEEGFTPLHCAIIRNNNPAIEALIPALDDLNMQSLQGHTPLSIAIVKKNQRAIELLIRFGADLNSNNCEGYSPLFYAVFRQNIPAFDLLIRSGCILNMQNHEETL